MKIGYQIALALKRGMGTHPLERLVRGTTAPLVRLMVATSEKLPRSPDGIQAKAVGESKRPVNTIGPTMKGYHRRQVDGERFDPIHLASQRRPPAPDPTSAPVCLLLVDPDATGRRPLTLQQ